MTRSVRWAIVLVVLFVVCSVAAATLVLWSLSGGAPWRRTSVLWLKVDGPVAEVASHDALSRMLKRNVADFRDMLDALDRASQDSRIAGLFLEIGQPGLGSAQNEELRAAIARFRKSGKWAWSYMETAGEASSGDGAYMLAAACDKVMLAPPGDLGLTGLRAETPFAKGLLDKLEIVPQFGQRKEFKNAVNTFTEKDYTPAHREATQRLLDSLYGDLVDSMAKARRMPPDRMRQVIAGGPYTASESLRLGLVDELLYRDEVIDKIETQVGREEPLVSISEYLRSGRPHESGWKKIAVVYAVGTITRGKSGSSPLMGEVMGSDTIAEALRTAREDNGVAAVVLRVDSPGGSYVASDVIRREVALTKKEKPLVVSMGNYAASGGYFISMDGAKILADSTTITGSIGVFGGKMVTSAFWGDKLGIRWSPLQTAENGAFFSTQSEYTAEGWARLNAWLDRIYTDFTTKAAAGRGMKVEALEPLAHGRVWSGKDALERKLIDRIGGLYDALDQARQMANIEPDARYEVEILPQPPGLLDMLFGRGDTFTLPAEARQALRLLALLQPEGDERLLLDPTLPRIR